MSGFNAISLKLKEMYQMITMGGDAELELVDSLDPFSEGILFRRVGTSSAFALDMRNSGSVVSPPSAACARPRRAGRTSPT